MRVVNSHRRTEKRGGKKRAWRKAHLLSRHKKDWQEAPEDRYTQAQKWRIRQKTRQEVQGILSCSYATDQEFFNVLGHYIEENRDAFALTYSAKERKETAPFCLYME